jgi:uncharacterized protein (TIGR02594 family)
MGEPSSEAMKSDPKYPWINTLKGIPNTIRRGMELHGIAEIVGKGSSATILGWRDELNLAGVKISGYSDDDIAWCGLFAAIVTLRRMKQPAEVVKSPLWARNWAKYGIKSPAPGLGDILVFSRGSGGHVGFYVAEDSTAYHVLGGNQFNKVSITRVAKDRLLAARRPVYASQPSAVKPYRVAATGTLSKDEA